jgi:oxygen-independent coproporphyrinogen-3 oxidase
MTEPLGVYVHVPFCRERCAYCDFAIVTGQERRVPEYEAALSAEIDVFAAHFGVRSADTIHFGGGTPSRVDPAVIARVLERLARAFAIGPGAEIALEANPEDVTVANLGAWRAAGINRVTIGLQALVPEGLLAIGRPNTVDEGRRAVETAAAAGLRSLGADLIFGRPGQTTAAWERELAQIAALPVDHLSLYALETDGRTPLVRSIERGATPAPDGDAAAEMYEAAVAALAAAGLPRYEVSNFARAGHRSRHNMKYWTDAPYVGFGPSAASYVEGARWIAPRRFTDYVPGPKVVPPADAEAYDPERRAGEAMVFGLRLADGIDLPRLSGRHGAGPVARRVPALERGVAAGLAWREGGRYGLTDRGFLLADEVFVELL